MLELIGVVVLCFGVWMGIVVWEFISVWREMSRKGRR